MHLLVRENRTIDEQAEAEALDLSPAPVVALSFSDSDLAVLWRAARDGGSTDWLRPARLARLRHPMSVDLFLERTVPGSGLVLVRLLGGIEYWRYGAEELAACCRREGVALAFVPGCDSWDSALVELSTVPADALRRLHGFLKHGGTANGAALVALLRHLAGLGTDDGAVPLAVPPAGTHRRAPDGADRPRAAVVFYRSHLLAGDTAPVEALGAALEERGLAADLIHVSSLKNADARALLFRHLRDRKPDVILNATFFSAAGNDGGSVLDEAGVPVLQVLQPGIEERAWRDSPRGLGPADLAMQVVLPEIDGRLSTAPISFKHDGSEAGDVFAPGRNAPWAPGIALAADRAAGWARLARAKPSERRIAIVLSDYPGLGGQAGHAVGLDSFASLEAMLEALRGAGYALGADPVPAAAALARMLLGGAAAGGTGPGIGGAEYRAALNHLPEAVRIAVGAAWGEPAAEGYRFDALHLGRVTVAVQPDRGDPGTRRDSYHDPALPPAHRFVAFHSWLREVLDVHALVQLGAHGTLEWLPGKAAAPGADCAPTALSRGLPVIYPFICNDPGEAAAAKRRLGAAVITHLTPPVRDAGLPDGLDEVERLMDEYAAAAGLHRSRGELLRTRILERAAASGAWAECGADRDADPDDGLQRLGAWLCDVKEFQIREGLHVFGRRPAAPAALRDGILRGAPGADPGRVARALSASPGCEMRALLRALDGGFVSPGPAGAPSRNRPDVLPTGRNPFGVDPRAIPTPAAARLAEGAAAALLARHEQARGEPLRTAMLHLWGSTSLRTGGEDVALALILLGVSPCWDAASGRVSGFTVEPLAVLDRPRVDVTLRISGFFRDGFPDQIALLDQAVRAVAARDEDDDWNPLAAERRAGRDPARIYGAAPGAYGAGIETALATGSWDTADSLARDFLDAGAWRYGATGNGVRDADGFQRRVAGADALVHIQDHAETDLLEGLDAASHAGGFAAAASVLGTAPLVWHADTSRPERSRVRPLAEQLVLVVRARAANPEWIGGMRRHGARGATEIARTVDALHGFAVLLPEPAHGRFDAQFDRLYAATLGDPAVDAFLRRENPAARAAMAARFREAARRGAWRPRSNGAALAGDEP